MPYQSNAQLPEAVRNSLSEGDQTKWREIFNSSFENTCNGDDVCAAKVAWSRMKKNARYFSGWASAEVIDRQGDMVEMGAFKKTMDLFMHLGSSIIDQHSNRKVGQYINYEFKEKMCEDGTLKPGVFMEGVVYKGQRIHDDVWKKIQTGEYSGLSIGADPIQTERQCDAKTCWNAIKNIDLFEISVVEIPANQEATIEEVNTLAKSDITFIGDTMAEEPKPIEKAAETGDGAPAVEEQPIAKSDEILTLLKGMDSRLSALESKLEKAEEEKPPEEDEEDDMEEKSAITPEEIGEIVEKTLEKALQKRLDAKEADTPRPEHLKKNDLDKSKIQEIMGAPDKIAKMSIAEIDRLCEMGGEAKPW